MRPQLNSGTLGGRAQHQLRVPREVPTLCGVACLHIAFAFASPPELATLVDRFQSKTGLDFSVEYAHHDPRPRGFAYDDSASAALPTGESVEFFRNENTIAVEFIQGAWRQDYLGQAALSLVAKRGGVPKHNVQSPRWAEKSWAEVPKIHLVFHDASAPMHYWLFGFPSPCPSEFFHRFCPMRAGDDSTNSGGIARPLGLERTEPVRTRMCTSPPVSSAAQQAVVAVGRTSSCLIPSHWAPVVKYHGSLAST
jgi:hypothetical protein